MSSDSDIKTAVSKLATMKPGRPLERFITHIRFPRFKNLQPGARIDFGFPLTALVGTNGCGKTSVLHALYGAPERKSTSDYWFATSVDPIDHRADDPQRFIYGHWLKDKTWLPHGGTVETRKARVKKEGDPEYWEPTKVTSGDEMAAMPGAGSNPQFGGPKERVRSLDRWSAVKREVLYLNFRGELGAFDQFFWFGSIPHRRTKVNTKQDEIRSKAQQLKKALDHGTESLVWHGRRRVFSHVIVSTEDLSTASEILGKTYTAARMVEHNLYGDQRSRTALFFVSELAYSEAFAGSGEIAILNFVVQVRKQPRNTLILLDEPEVSLHPGAQKRLLLFLLEECRKKHHQVVFTTHSPHLVEGLPSNAIKVFTQDASGKFSVLNDVHPYAAFHRLGATPPGRIKVLVEDRLAKHVVDLALKLLDEASQNVFDVDFLPGGADHYFSHRIPTLMRESSTWLLLDGDQKKGAARASATVAEADLDATIEGVVGTRTIVYGADSDLKSLVQSKQNYLDYLHTRVRYLPRSCPEEIVLRAVDVTAEPKSSFEAKELLREHLERIGLTPSSTESDAQAQLLLAQHRTGNQDLVELTALLEEMLGATSGAAAR